MQLEIVDPLADERWEGLVLQDPRASVFHSRGWLQALQRTYGYRPLVITASVPGGPLDDGIAFCEIRSWATGTRLVSLPFSDHCEPLVNDTETLSGLLNGIAALRASNGWRYIEVRPASCRFSRETDARAGEAGASHNLQAISSRNQFRLAGSGFAPSAEFCFHKLDLRANLSELSRNLHPDCVRRKVRRAEREGLGYESGRSEALLQKFYFLLIKTRRRHCLPPQPVAWFRNLLACLGERVQIRLALKQGVPVAAILTLTFKDKVIYKYGCSDHEFHNLGGMPFLFWRTIEEAHADGFAEFDLGRTDSENSGLIAFKEHLGAKRERLRYFRAPGEENHGRRSAAMSAFRKRLFAVLPDSMMCALGRLLYRHAG